MRIIPAIMRHSPLSLNGFGNLTDDIAALTVQACAYPTTNVELSAEFSAYENAQRLSAQLTIAQTRRAQLQHELNEVNDHYAHAAQQFAACGAAGKITATELAAATTNAKKFAETLERENALRIDAQNAFTALAQAGISRDEAWHWSEFLTTVNADDFLWNYTATAQNLAAKQAVENEQRRQNDAHWAMLKTIEEREKRGAFRQIGLALSLMLLSLIVLGVSELLAWAVLPTIGCIGIAVYGCFRYRQTMTFQKNMTAELQKLANATAAATAALNEQLAAQTAQLSTLAATGKITLTDLNAALTKFTPRRAQFLFWQKSHQRLQNLEADKNSAFRELQTCLQMYNFGSWENYALPRLDYYLNELHQGAARRAQVETLQARREQLTTEIAAQTAIIDEIAEQIAGLKLKISIMAKRG